MENLDELVISTEDGLILILVDRFCHPIVFNPKWNSDGYGLKTLTLKEIYEQVNVTYPNHRTIMVMVEADLHGDIYLCGNYEHGQWVRHGETRGYA